METKDIEQKRQIPAISEIYSTFYAFNLDDIKKWNPLSYPDCEGVFEYKDKLISVTRIKKGQFKYIAMFSSGALDAANLSRISTIPIRSISSSIAHDALEGFYVCIVKKIPNSEEYEPEAFSYLISDITINNRPQKSIIPFLVLSTTIPIELIQIWVYLALKHLSDEYLPDVEYLYLLETDLEKSLANSII